LSDDSLPVVEADNSVDALLSELQTEVRDALDKSRRVETAAGILIDAKETLREVEEN
jgi:hypothetical protein